MGPTGTEGKDGSGAAAGTGATTTRSGRVVERTISAFEARREFTQLMGTARFADGQRTIITWHGQEGGAFVGLDDLQRLRELDRLEAGADATTTADQPAAARASA